VIVVVSFVLRVCVGVFLAIYVVFVYPTIVVRVVDIACVVVVISMVAYVNVCGVSWGRVVVAVCCVVGDCVGVRIIADFVVFCT